MKDKKEIMNMNKEELINYKRYSKELKHPFKTKKYKPRLIDKVIVEFCGWIGLIFFIGGIWYAPARGRLIFTSLFALFIASIISKIDINNERKFNKDLTQQESGK